MKSRWKVGLTASAALTAALTLASCSASTTTDAGTDKSETITYVHEQEPPCIWGGWVQQAYLSRQVFDSLVSWDGDKPVPWLATEWSTSADRKDVTFVLKDGVTFTDGTPLNAEAVVANVNYWVKNLGWNSFSYLTSATADSADKVTLHLSEPNPEILRVLANGHYGIQSPTALSHNSEAQNCQYPVGSGPWKVGKWSQGQSILFERNDSYASAPQNAKHQGPAYAKYLEWKFAPDATTRWSALTTGQAQAVYNPPANQWATAEKDYQAFNYVTGGRQQAFSFNVARGPFTDVKVRQAFAYASDRKQIAQAVFKGSADYDANGSMSHTNPFYLDVNDTYAYDPARAAKLLDEAGWKLNADGVREKDGKPLVVRLPYGAGPIVSQDGTAALQAVQEQVSKVGFKLDLVPLTMTQLFAGEGQSVDDLELYFGYWVWPAPNILDIVYSAGTPGHPNGNNKTFFDNPQVEAQIMAAQVNPDPAARAAQYQDLQRYFNDQAIAIGFYDFTNNVVTAKNLKGFWQDQGSNGLPVFSDVQLDGSQ
ncbi:ABC transporter substrate-binding protein [Gordonia sp. NB41Y]|uniref:ABC transporter substrate-binding protein n=1 Tax=Gordonia sp. NB41Y TaxID=875808 RepID=UPI0006B175A9|nr:ABC transporter substrate-binding protein [Gordonia sp. NB41Y]KOY48904.1 ABC transporter substrate-binding protein [Gordonia sp. NB41Y]WLP92113.1 ABC transporter substrate-binding protein [Gordonia sp. NB41Y]